MAASSENQYVETEMQDNRESLEEDEELMLETLPRLPSPNQGNLADGVAGAETNDVWNLSRRERLDRIGLEVPKVEVRFQNLKVVAGVQTGSRALPTLINFTRDLMTPLLGPPGSGKSTLPLALAGKLSRNLEISGDITYNGHKLHEFHVQRTSAYISQMDHHIADLTVRETLDFAARCQGSSEAFAGYLKDLIRLEKERNIRSNPEIDAFMMASSVGGEKHSVLTDHVLQMLGLDICSETVVGDDTLRGVSCGQRKRVTTEEYLVYQGPRAEVSEFFESLGFRLPARKAVADFLQEVTSKKDQAQYWADPSIQYQFLPVSEMANAFKLSNYGRFFRYMLLIFSTHQMALSLYRMMATIARDMVIANTFGASAVLCIFLLNGFVIPKDNSVGYNVLHLHSLPDDDHWYWVGVEALLLYAFLFNNILTMALAYLHLASKKFERNTRSAEESFKKKGMILPFQPLIMSFHYVNYSVDMPKAMSLEGEPTKKLQLLSNVSGVFSPGVLTALVGSSGARKTTLMDVLAGRKTGGYIEGDIRISGYPKEQRTFARISGYVEQNDIRSPQVFVEEVMRLAELDSLRHALVGLPDSFGLTTEQRKRLTIAVELVANPSIIFMDEPTSGLDARAAAIVMRTVRNTGRTVVCTIHQPSEAFDEIGYIRREAWDKLKDCDRLFAGDIHLPMFLGVRGVAPIPCGYNLATWMLEVTPPAVEEKIGVDFADVYKNSEQYRKVESSIKNLSVPPAGSEPLKFSTYSQDQLSQCWICLWKQNRVYWRSPEYNVVRVAFTMVAALVFGSIFWDVSSHRDTTKDLLMVMGALYAASLFLGVNSASSVQPIVSIYRTVFYRERAARMYSPFAYAVAQGVVEIPYIAVQTIIYGIITHYMVNFERTARKLFLYLVFMFLTFYGMMAVGLTPNQNLADVVSSAFYSIWNLFSGFLVAKPSLSYCRLISF
ncbi:hypothetical protein Pint_32396 [Pistacia integerrima]|uniref:Uncharacterized protein n=1 Tax=Pistacia integerrima TaxID=434235 RepID=A0ACC0XM79_9ROSI|nr:hypothetical protein Pint_32396 [Pistacia integerrima]